VENTPARQLSSFRLAMGLLTPHAMSSSQFIQSALSPAPLQTASIQQLWSLTLWGSVVIFSVVVAFVFAAVERNMHRPSNEARSSTSEKVVTRSGSATIAVTFVMLVSLLSATVACRSREQILSEQEKALTSLRATTVAVCEAWLSGAVSSTFARTALQVTQDLLQKHHVTLTASSPDALADPAARSVSESENQLAQTLALLWKGINEGDSLGVRRQLSTVASDQSRFR